MVLASQTHHVVHKANLVDNRVDKRVLMKFVRQTHRVLHQVNSVDKDNRVVLVVNKEATKAENFNLIAVAKKIKADKDNRVGLAVNKAV